MKYTLKTYFDDTITSEHTFSNAQLLNDYLDENETALAESVLEITDETGRQYDWTEIEELAPTLPSMMEEMTGCYRAAEPAKTFTSTTYVQRGKRWELSCQHTDKAYVLGKLAEDLIHKKLESCRYIRSILREQHYDGTMTITVLYDNGVKTVYDVPTSLY